MGSDAKAWARKLVAEYEGDRPPKPTNVYRVAYAALHLTFPEGEPPQTRRAAQHPAPRSAPVENPWWDHEPRHSSEEGDE